MNEFSIKEIEAIKLKLDLIIQQNINIQNQLEEISEALSEKSNIKNYNKAVDKFLNDFINNYP